MDPGSSNKLEAQREKYRTRITAALEEEEDPLSAYHDFVKWTIDNYPNKLIARSGLLELLEEATRRFKDDSAYKSDLRYLKLWSLFASHVEDPSAIYDFLLANDIGKIYAQVYEEYAASLEAQGRRTDADKIYQLGIQRRARPLERLKKRYTDFQSRPSSSRSNHHSSSLWRDATPQTQALRRDPFMNYSPKPGQAHRPKSNPPQPSSTSPPGSSSLTGPGHNRYAHILAPPAQGKRPEKLRFNLSLLFTEEGVEYSVAEARARSMGLLGKKWGPPPASESSRSVRVGFNDDGSKGTRNMTGRKGVGFSAPEPTVTLATKEALADVFGMYNSPDRSQRFGPVAGSKHAPVRKIEPMTPMALLPQFRATTSNENADSGKTPSTFRPYVDQSANRKENSTPAPPPKFKPFVDEIPNSGSGAPSRNENAHPPKTPGAFRPLQEQSRAPPKVFTPAGAPMERVLSRKDIFVDEPKETSRPSEASVFSAPKPNDQGQEKIKPYVDPQPPFKVFSRPPSSTENAPPPSVFKPFVDNAHPSRQPFVPTRSVLGERTPLRPPQPIEEAEEQMGDPEEDYYDYSTTESSDVDDAPNNIEVPIMEGEEDPSVYDDDEVESYQVPLGGRLGQFNVMTPITERTYEFTSSTRGLPTPHDPLGRNFHNDPVGAAEQLAAELRQEEVEDDEVEEDEMKYIEERTGTLSLSDAIGVVTKFNPSNPCNPFDPAIMSTLLSLVPTDPGFRDLRSQESNQLDALQKFGRKKVRRASGNSSSSRLGSDDDSFGVDLSGRSYAVTDKLGEGGFGAVFAAVDLHAAAEKRKQSGMDDEDSEDDYDEEETPRVALKVVKPRNLWEFHILRQIHRALSPQLRRSTITPEALYAFRDESFLVLELCDQGTLLDIVNRAGQAGITQQGACLDELLVMFFSIELIRFIEGMHKSGFIHGDVKIDNCLLRLDDVPGPASAWSSVYQPSGGGGWGYKGIKMIDFGRTIDTKLFPSGQSYMGDWATDARDCLEMRDGKSWTYQTDYFGLAGIIYCLLYGKYIEASSVVSFASEDGLPRYKLSTPFKRYWQGDIWTRLFDLLLNSGTARPDGKLPLCEELGDLRVEMETWLQANCNRASNSLKGLLKKIGLSLLGGKDSRR